MLSETSKASVPWLDEKKQRNGRNEGRKIQQKRLEKDNKRRIN